MLRPSMFMLLARSGIMRLVFKLMTDRRVPLRLKVIIPAAIVYLLSPFDLVPDIIPVSGWIDDILVIVLSLIFFLASVPRDVLLEHVRRGRSGRGTGAKREGKIVDGEYRVIDDDPQGKQ